LSWLIFHRMHQKANCKNCKKGFLQFLQ